MMRLALGFVLAMLAFGGAALWTIRQIDPVLRLGTAPAEVRTVEVALPRASASPMPSPEPEPVELAPRADFVEAAAPEPPQDDGDEPPPGPVVRAAAADAPSADESAALIRRMLSVYRRTARPDRTAP